MTPLRFSLLCALATCVSASASPNGHAIPLFKKNDVFQKRDGFAPDLRLIQSQVERTMLKFAAGLSASERNWPAQKLPLPPKLAARKKRATGAIPLADVDGLWSGNLTVGTPAQTFSVAYDTGSSDTFLPAVGCDDSCDGHTLYNTAASSSAVNTTDPFFLQFGEGNATGIIFNDTVQIGGLTATSQAVGASNHYSVDFEIENFPPDGLVGLAFPARSRFNGRDPLLQTLVAQGQTAPVFAFKLAETGAELFIGGVNPANFKGAFRNVTIIKEERYNMALQGLAVNNRVVSKLQNTTVIVDSGTSVIVGFTKDVEALYSHVPGAKASTDFPGIFTVPCDCIPTVGIQMGGHVFNIEPENFNLGVLEGNDCIGGVVAADTAPFWVLGGIVFMQNFYTVFDQGNSVVGFATPR